MADVETLAGRVIAAMGERVRRVPALAHELAFEVDATHLVEVCRELRDRDDLRFEMLMDLAGVDYLHYGLAEWKTFSATRTGYSRAVTRHGASTPGDATESEAARRGRFGITLQLLSITLNQRLRLRCRCPGGDDPVVDSVTGIWASANWFEREAFDLFGILFDGHPDLRRILTDYGFIGHPFRKDFPLIGNVEVRYDPEKKRVVYEPVGIEPRVLVPKVIREDNRYAPELTAGRRSEAPEGTRG